MHNNQSRPRTFRNLLLAPAALALLVAVASSARAQTPAASVPAEMPAATQGHGMKSNIKATDLQTSMDRMHEKMTATSMTGDPDVDFATMMRTHHQGAIEMAQAEIDHGNDAAMRRAAKKIIVAQKKEIAEFERWLSAHKK